MHIIDTNKRIIIIAISPQLSIVGHKSLFTQLNPRYLFSSSIPCQPFFLDYRSNQPEGTLLEKNPFAPAIIGSRAYKSS